MVRFFRIRSLVRDFKRLSRLSKSLDVVNLIISLVEVDLRCELESYGTVVDVSNTSIESYIELNQEFNRKYGIGFAYPISNDLNQPEFLEYVNRFRISTCDEYRTLLQTKQIDFINSSEDCVNAINFLLTNGNENYKYFAEQYLYDNIKQLAIYWKINSELDRENEIQDMNLPSSHISDSDFCELICNSVNLICNSFARKSS